MRIFFISIILLGTSALAQVIPQPSHAEFGKGFYCGKTTSILLDNNAIDAISKATYSPDDEAYILDVTDSGIKITAESPIGRLRATQTLAQLTDAKGNVRHCHIKDHPAYAWRGAMIDVSRHFFTIDFLKKQIDVLINGKGTLDDEASMIANLMQSGKLDAVAELITKGAFGEIEGLTPQMSEADKKSLEILDPETFYFFLSRFQLSA